MTFFISSLRSGTHFLNSLLDVNDFRAVSIGKFGEVKNKESVCWHAHTTEEPMIILKRLVQENPSIKRKCVLLLRENIILQAISVFMKDKTGVQALQGDQRRRLVRIKEYNHAEIIHQIQRLEKENWMAIDILHDLDFEIHHVNYEDFFPYPLQTRKKLKEIFCFYGIIKKESEILVDTPYQKMSTEIETYFYHKFISDLVSVVIGDRQA